MATVAIVTNQTIPQNQFIPLLIVTSIISLICTVRDRLNRAQFRKEDRILGNEKAVLRNDILRVVPIISKDQETRISRYQALSHEQFGKKRRLIQKDFLTDIISNLARVTASCTLILLYVLNSNEITLETVAGMAASLAVFNSSIRSFDDIVHLLSGRSHSWDDISKEEPLMKIILEVYHKSESTKKQNISSLSIHPFSIMYSEKSENDKPFALSLSKDITINMGDRVVLTGASGSGKSTFLKVCTNRIMFHELSSSEIVPVNYMYYDDTVDFGSMPLWDEMFCLDNENHKNPTDEEIIKMEYILKQLMIYQELSENCTDLWTWMQQHTGKELSRGQKQRMIVAKILFWLDESIDIIALDECTSGLDAESDDSENADAIQIMNFIIDYCNRDRKRILIMATHQNISSLCNKQLHFKRKNGQTNIKCVN